MNQEILDAVEELASDHNKEFVHKFLLGAEEENPEVTFQLDKPLVRIFRPDGTQACTLHLPTAELVVYGVDPDDLP